MRPIKSQPLYLQVEEFVREKIASGEYAVNSKLPSTSALVAITGTSTCTVQTALSKLCREGLLDRTVGKHTYVKGDKGSLSCVGLYFNRPLFNANLAYFQVLSQELRRKLSEQGVKVRVWTDEREEAHQTEPPASLQLAMEQRHIQGLIAPLSIGDNICWLRKSPVAVAVLGSNDTIKSRVSADFRDFIRLGLTELKNQGCRTVGVISHLIVRPDSPTSDEMIFYRALVDIVSELGMETRNKWIRLPAQHTPHFAQFGYEQFNELWKLRQRPEGLLVHPDIMVTGVISAILERRLNIPQDLKVVFHANDLIPYVCPFPATFLTNEVERCADALIQMVRVQLAGGEAVPVRLPITLVREGSPFSARSQPTSVNTSLSISQ